MILSLITLQASSSGGNYSFLTTIAVIAFVVITIVRHKKKVSNSSSVINTQTGYLTKDAYSKTKLYPAIICVVGSIMLGLILSDTKGSFIHFIYELFLIPGMLILAFLAIKNFIQYYKIINVPDEEWDEFIKRERILLSLAVYVHPITGDTKTVRRGFSLPVFLFGGFVPLVRGQWTLAIKFWVIIFALDLIGSIIPVVGNLIAHFLGSFGIARKYNEHYENWLLSQGYFLQDAHGIVNDITNVNETRKVITSSTSMSDAYVNAKKQLNSNRIISSNESIDESDRNQLSLEDRDKIECSNCKTLNSKTDLFCYNCGTSLSS